MVDVKEVSSRWSENESLNELTLSSGSDGGDDEMVHDQLPSPEEAKARPMGFTESRQKGIRRSMVAAILCMGAVFVLIVILSIRIVRHNSSESNTMTVPRASRETEVLAYLSGVSDAEGLDDSSSPQRQAAQWIADLDPLYLDIPSIENGLEARFRQRYAVAVLSFALGIHNHNKDGISFLTESHECKWNGSFARQGVEGSRTPVDMGVFCKNRNDVDEIVVEALQLRGTLPEEIRLLTKLETLKLEANHISSPLPSTMQELGALRELTLSVNELSGSLPSWLGSLTRLEVLEFSKNNYTGTLPVMMARMTDLRTLALDHNELEGKFSPFIGPLTQLEEIYLENNRFMDVLDDDTLVGFNNARLIDVSGNELGGSIPAHMLVLPKLEILDLSANNIEYPFPEVPTPSTTLRFLDVHDNLLEAFSESIGNLGELTHLDVSYNRMDGPIPVSLGDLVKLEFLYLGNEHFDVGPIPDFLQNLVNLEELNLQATGRTGTIPDWIGGFDHLELLDLSWNGLNGTLPTALANLEDLRFLLLNANFRIEGTVPSDLGRLSNLQLLLLDHTKLAGVIPGEICAVESLTTFYADCGNQEDCGPDFCFDGPFEITSCPCCSNCCPGSFHDLDRCNMRDWYAYYEDQWSMGYERTEYVFSEQDVSFPLAPP